MDHTREREQHRIRTFTVTRAICTTALFLCVLLETIALTRPRSEVINSMREDKGIDYKSLCIASVVTGWLALFSFALFTAFGQSEEEARRQPRNSCRCMSIAMIALSSIFAAFFSLGSWGFVCEQQRCISHSQPSLMPAEQLMVASGVFAIIFIVVPHIALLVFGILWMRSKSVMRSALPIAEDDLQHQHQQQQQMDDDDRQPLSTSALPT